eukprot:TRINITY_DN25527_c0_g1_i2.p1 TRINITY_DN25527_c0_g1~~TRINITY_DN25527_c0_g1_i2.p1  ORF type:complete len:386 (+),score=20.13 TRINITY_DN25527_c0_g1_i2:37-1194(+)
MHGTDAYHVSDTERWLRDKGGRAPSPAQGSPIIGNYAPPGSIGRSRDKQRLSGQYTAPQTFAHAELNSSGPAATQGPPGFGGNPFYQPYPAPHSGGTQGGYPAGIRGVPATQQVGAAPAMQQIGARGSPFPAGFPGFQSSALSPAIFEQLASAWGGASPNLATLMGGANAPQLPPPPYAEANAAAGPRVISVGHPLPHPAVAPSPPGYGSNTVAGRGFNSFPTSPNRSQTAPPLGFVAPNTGSQGSPTQGVVASGPVRRSPRAREPGQRPESPWQLPVSAPGSLLRSNSFGDPERFHQAVAPASPAYDLSHEEARSETQSSAPPSGRQSPFVNEPPPQYGSTVAAPVSPPRQDAIARSPVGRRREASPYKEDQWAAAQRRMRHHD